ncbi:hypothetical protein [Ferrovibrio xuzhouensis]|uniref:Colicin import membrane protein n=1 Tax=Ferrovibrio xuzhouensis TaxID=1576914 RepID=A0ABV7VFY1_9PROT
MVTEIGGESAPPSTTLSAPRAAAGGKIVAARDALAALSAPRKKTEAEQKLDAILRDLKTTRGKAAQEAARRKLDRIKAKLEALKLAAGSAAATGDAKLARRVAKEIRDAARDLGRALADAGSGGGSAVATAASAGVAAAPAEAAAPGADDKSSTAVPSSPPAAGSDDLASLKADAQGVLKELKKILRKLRETGLHPGLDRKDRAAMERMLAEADRSLAGLAAAAAPSVGGTVDLVA